MQAATKRGWMIVSEETVFSWVPVPKLTIMVSSVAFPLPTNNLSVGLIGTKTTPTYV
jgi:hypothetical protein